MVCERHFEETLGLVISMSDLADRLSTDHDNDSCLVVAGVIRDSVSAIRCAAAQPGTEFPVGNRAATGRQAPAPAARRSVPGRTHPVNSSNVTNAANARNTTKKEET